MDTPGDVNAAEGTTEEGERTLLVRPTARVTGLISTRAGALALTEGRVVFITEKGGVELSIDRSSITEVKMGKANALVRITAGGQTHKFDFARTTSLTWFNASRYGFSGSSTLGPGLAAIANIKAVTQGRDAAKPFLEALSG